MSIIKDKEQIKSDEKILENPITDSRQKSISMAKELIKKLLHDTLDNSLFKLESNSSNYMTSLKTSSKSLNDYSKLINNLIKNVEENKKKKTKDKKPQILKRGIMKTLTQQNLLTRNRIIDSNLNQFRSKAELGTINNKKSNINKNNNLKFFKKVNPNSKNVSYRTNINFRTNDNESIEDTASQKYIKFPNYANNTVQNFRKNIFKSGPEETRRKIKSKIKDKHLNRTFYQYDKGKKSMTNLFNNKINNAKKLEHFPEKNLHPKTLTLNNLTDIDERIENITLNNKTTKNVKNQKILYKNDKKGTLGKLNNQHDKIDEKKNKINNSKNLVKNKEKEINEIQVENIVKLVDNVNQNLNKLLSENPNRKNINIKEGNNKINTFQDKFRRSKTLVYPIKDTEIKQTIDNKNESNKIENEKIENKNTIIVNDNNIKEKKEIKDNLKIISSPKSEKKANSNSKIFDINKKPKKEENNFINKINNITNKEIEEIKILKLRKNKSNPKTKSMYNVFKIINDNNTKYHRSFKEIINVININENKKEQIIKGIIDTEKNDENSYKKINTEIIKQIRYKMKEKVDKINEQNKILEKELLNQSKNNIINSEQRDKKGKLDVNQNLDNNEKKDNIDIKDKKENIRNVDLKINRSSNKSLKNVIKNNIICEHIIKRVKSVGKIRNKYLLI